MSEELSIECFPVQQGIRPTPDSNPMNGQDARLIVNFAPTGMIPTREMTPHVPASAAEVV